MAAWLRARATPAHQDRLVPWPTNSA